LQLGHFYKITGRLYESFSAYAHAIELAPDWTAARDELEALRDSVRSRVELEGLAVQQLPEQANRARMDLRGSVRARVESEGLVRVPTDVTQTHPHRVLWLGSNGLSSQREREILTNLGFEVFFRRITHRFADESVAHDRGVAPAGLNVWPTAESGVALRKEFSSIVVENDVTTLAEYVRFFPGKIIFRSYGITRQFGGMLWDSGAHELARQRRNLIYAPTISEAVTIETRLEWLQHCAAPLPALHATDDDLRHLQWTGPSSTRRPVAILVPNKHDADEHSRRHRAFVDETFPPGDVFWHIELPCLSDAGLGGTLLDDARLTLLSDASALLYTEHSRTILPGYAQQAFMMGVPVMYFAGSMFARFMDHGPGEAASIAHVHGIISQLLDNDTSVVGEILAHQDRVVEQIRTSQDRISFGKAFSDVLRAPLEEPAVPIRRTQDIVSTNWRQFERFVACLMTGSASPECETDTRTIVDCMFHVILERDPRIEEICEYWDRATDPGDAIAVFKELVRTPEGRAFWPINQIWNWLETHETVAAGYDRR
jgi:hypothetical protein